MFADFQRTCRLTYDDSLDAETDDLIRKIIRDKFCHHTVISVSHSAENLLDCDKVLVIDQGRVMEFNKPGRLASKQNSKFNQMFLNPRVSLQPA
jgi:ABC-type multidrug transport system fused ATPase/permease subunit